MAARRGRRRARAQRVQPPRHLRLVVRLQQELGARRQPAEGHLQLATRRLEQPRPQQAPPSPQPEHVLLLRVVGGDLDHGAVEVEWRLAAPAVLGICLVKLLVLVERHAPVLGDHVHFIPRSASTRSDRYPYA